MHKQLPAREVLVLDGFIQVALVGFAVASHQFLGLGIGEVFDALLGPQVELDPVALIVGIDKAEGVTA
ncbi:hypothetical protein AO268_10570, partial [Pseudomonas sp. ICMP 8385]